MPWKVGFAHDLHHDTDALGVLLAISAFVMQSRPLQQFLSQSFSLLATSMKMYQAWHLLTE